MIIIILIMAMVTILITDIPDMVMEGVIILLMVMVTWLMEEETEPARHHRNGTTIWA
jgi:hypothetical protein